MWKIGPECAAQHRKNTTPSTTNWRDRSATASELIGPSGTSFAAGAAAGTDDCRTNTAAGINNTHARMPMRNIAVRQSYAVINQRASGEIVIGATPMPAETSDTARLRCVSNHAVVNAIIGAKNVLAARPTRTPYTSWNCSSDCARLARTNASPSSTAPIDTTRRVP